MVEAGAPEAASVRVAFVSDSMPERNGVGAYYADLIAQLEGTEFAPTFVCPGGAASGGFHFPLPGDATQQVFVPSPREFRGIMKRLKPHVVVVATPGPYGMLGVRWARKLGVRLIVGFHTDYAGVTDLYQGSLLRLFSRGYFRVVDRVMFRYADHVLANSAQMIEQAEAMGARKVSRIGTLLPKSVLETERVSPRPEAGTGAVRRPAGNGKAPAYVAGGCRKTARHPFRDRRRRPAERKWKARPRVFPTSNTSAGFPGRT